MRYGASDEEIVAWQKILLPLEGADLSLAYLHGRHPYCKKHGAMLTVNGQVYRCMGVMGKPVGKGAKCPGQKTKPDFNACRAGCVIE